MCGRFTLAKPAQSIAELFLTLEFEDIEPRYNIAPTQPVLTVLNDPESRRRAPRLMHWGLIPFWAKDVKIAYKLINARSETAAEKPSFRAAFKYRRCLIPCDGFYEWKKLDERRKQPYYIQAHGGGLFAIAGLWEHWSGPGGEEIDSCTLLTTDANQTMAPVHDRMPVILNRDDFAMWLDPDVHEKGPLQALCKPAPDDLLTMRPVSAYVSRAGNEGPRCIEPLKEPETKTAPKADQGQMDLF